MFFNMSLTLPYRTSLVAEVRPAQQIKKKDLKLNSSRNSGRLTPVLIQSRPVSPALGTVSQSDDAVFPHSPASNKSRAQRFALVHLLAVNPTTQKEILRRTSIPADQCVPLLEKLAERDSTCWRLREKFFKELDIWGFPYPSEEERKSAIDHAIKAFDKQRLSSEDKLWQLLYPPNERNQGRTLSKLELTNTPLLSGARVQVASNSAAVGTPDYRNGLSGRTGTGTPRQASQEISKSQAGNAYADDSLVRLAPVEAVKPGSVAQGGTYLEGKKLTVNKKRKMGSSSFQSAKFVTNSDNGNDSQEAVTSQSAKEPPFKRLKSKDTPDIAPSCSSSVVETKTVVSATVKAKPATEARCHVESKSSKTAETDSNIPSPSAQHVKLEGPSGTKQELNGLGINITSNKFAPSTQDIRTAAASRQIMSQNQRNRVPVRAIIGKPKQPAGVYHEKPSSASSSASSFFDHATSRSVASSQSSISPPILKARPYITRQVPQLPQRRRNSDRGIDQATKKRKPEAATTQKPSPLGSSPSINASDDAVSSSDSPYTTGKNIAPVNLHYPETTADEMVQTRAGGRNIGGTATIKKKPTSKELQAVVEAGNPAPEPYKSKHPLAPSLALFPRLESKPCLQASRISSQELEMRADLALNEYLRVRCEVEEYLDKDATPPAGKWQELWERHGKYQQLFLQHGGKGDSDYILMASLSKDSSAYLDMKYVRLAKRYNQLVGSAQDDIGSLSDEQKEELRTVYDEISQIKTLVEHSNERQQAARTRDLIERAAESTAAASPPLRCQTLELYKQFYQDMATYKDYLERLRLKPAYPHASVDELEKATNMCTRLVGMRKDLEYGFNAMFEKASSNPSGRVTLAEEGGSVMKEKDAEAFMERLKLDAVEWQRRRELSLGRLGRAPPDEIASLFDELERMTENRYMLLRAAALDYGDREEGDLGELHLVTFNPSDRELTTNDDA